MTYYSVHRRALPFHVEPGGRLADRFVGFAVAVLLALFVAPDVLAWLLAP